MCPDLSRDLLSTPLCPSARCCTTWMDRFAELKETGTKWKPLTPPMTFSSDLHSATPGPQFPHPGKEANRTQCSSETLVGV